MHITALVKNPDHVCCRYRVAAFRALLERAGHQLDVRGWPGFWLSRLMLYRHLRHTDVLLVQRKLLPAWQLRLVRARVRWLVYDFDDAVFLRNSYSPRGHDSPNRSRRFDAMVRQADAVVAGNDCLPGKRLAVADPARVQVIPTCVDAARYPRAAHDRRDGKVQMVWIGSSSTIKGLERLGPVLEELGKAIPELQLKVICDRSLSLQHMTVRPCAWQEATEAEDVAGADIGISWLPDDPWSRGKCGLKVLQYMAAGLPVVANPVGVQAQLVRHGQTGFLAETPAEWHAAVRRLAASPELCKAMGRAARRVVDAEYDVSVGASRWLALLDGLQGRALGVPRNPMSIATSSPSEARAGGFCWSLAPDLRQPLLDGAGLRLPEWLRAGQAHVVKRGPHRVVYRVELPGLCFYLKHNCVHDARTWLRQLVRPSKARREYDSIVAVAARGVPTVAPLALGERPALRGGESYLITRGLDGCEPLHVFLVGTLPKLPVARRTRVRQRLAEELGALVARIHDAGIRHDDLHAGNILVRHSADDRLALYLIDLNSVRIGAPLDWAASLDNLVMLNSWFVLRCNRTDRLRFWKAYYLGRGMGGWSKGPHGAKEHRHRAATIEEGTWRFNFRFWRRRDARSLRDNRYYRRVAGPGVMGHAVTEILDANLMPLLADPDAPFRQPGVRLLKDSPSSTVAELEMKVDGRPLRVVYKRFRITSALEPFVSLLRRTPALRSWVHGQGFRERALPTARTLAVLHRTRCGMRAEGYLLTEKIDDAQELHVHLNDLQRLPERQRMDLVRGQIDRVARTIRDLHQRQLSHRDLKAANILVRRWNAPAREPAYVSPTALVGLLHMAETAIWLIDLVGVELFRKLPRSRRIQNLARLNASFHCKASLTRTDRLRFLRTYLNWGLSGQGEWKSWWKAIDRATQEKAARNRRHGRPLE